MGRWLPLAAQHAECRLTSGKQTLFIVIFSPANVCKRPKADIDHPKKNRRKAGFLWIKVTKLLRELSSPDPSDTGKAHGHQRQGAGFGE